MVNNRHLVKKKKKKLWTREDFFSMAQSTTGRKSGYGNTNVYLLKILVWTNRTAVLSYILALSIFFALIPLYIKSIQTNKDILFNQLTWYRPSFPILFCSVISYAPLKLKKSQNASYWLTCSHFTHSLTHTHKQILTFNLWPDTAMPSQRHKQHNSATF